MAVPFLGPDRPSSGGLEKDTYIRTEIVLDSVLVIMICYGVGEYRNMVKNAILTTGLY